MLYRALASLTLIAAPALAQDVPSPQEIMEAWLASPHADATAEAFSHWDAEESVPDDCAVCHSGPGFVDYIGGDGTPAGTIDAPAPTGAPVSCDTCHNPAAEALASATFPSGVSVEGLGRATLCATCHQGREATDSVTAAVGAAEDDVVPGDLAFLNVHYGAAAATWLGETARGGYQYDGQNYADKFAHVPGLDSCTGCHDPHALTVAEPSCLTCHQGTDDVRWIRTTAADIDGDGDTSEGIAAEIGDLHDRLLAAILAYADDVAGTPIAYDAGAYPYFFTDPNGVGSVDAGEATYSNRYQNWTPRLLKAAYNYQFVAKDPGAFAHNPHYVLQLMYDSLGSLAERVDVDMSSFVRP